MWHSILTWLTGNSPAATSTAVQPPLLGKRPSSDSQSECKRLKIDGNTFIFNTNHINGSTLSKPTPSNFSSKPAWQYNLLSGRDAEKYVKQSGSALSSSSHFNVDSPRIFKSAARRYPVIPLIDLSGDDLDISPEMRRSSYSNDTHKGTEKSVLVQERFAVPLSLRHPLPYRQQFQPLNRSTPMGRPKFSGVSNDIGFVAPSPVVNLEPTEVEIVEAKVTMKPNQLDRMWARKPLKPVYESPTTRPTANGSSSHLNGSYFIRPVPQPTSKPMAEHKTKRLLTTLRQGYNLEEKERFHRLLQLQSSSVNNGYTAAPFAGDRTSSSGRSSVLSDSTVSLASSSSALNNTDLLDQSVFRSRKIPLPPYGALGKSYAAAVSSSGTPAQNYHKATAILKEVDESLSSTPSSERLKSPEFLLQTVRKLPSPNPVAAQKLIEIDSRSSSQSRESGIHDEIFDEIFDETVTFTTADRESQVKSYDEKKLINYGRRFTLDPSKLCRSIKEDYRPFLERNRADRARKEEELNLRQKARLAETCKYHEELRLKLRFEGLILPDEEEDKVEEEFPQLTDEQEEAISNAFKCRNPSEVLVEEFSIPIKRSDIETLRGLSWLNDEVINFYFNLIMARSKENEKLPNCYAFNTFFLKKLQTSGYGLVKRWTKKVDVFGYDLLFVPVHLGAHWCLAVVDFRTKLISYYDSMGGANDGALRALLQYLQEESLDKKKQKFDTFDWKTTNKQDVPQQMNGSDCGMFACKFAEYLSRDAKITFTQANMPYFRHRMVYEILTRRLM